MMTREELQRLRREVEAGRVTAPPFQDVVPRPTPRFVKVKEVYDQSAQQHEWNEDAFLDELYGADVDEFDAAPDYFMDCDQLVTTYAVSTTMDTAIPSQALFRGSEYTSKDLARFLLSFKAKHMKVGDGILANMVAMLATFLPSDNAFKRLLPEKTSIYKLLKTLDNLASFKTGLRTLKINTCVNKCMGFYADNLGLNVCPKCGESRWKHCALDCYGPNDARICSHYLAPRSSLYYNVVQDRLVKLLKSDIKNLFNYDYHRAGKL